MTYKESVKKKLEGDMQEIQRRGKLWDRIVEAYEKEGVASIQAFLKEKGKGLAEEFNELQRQIENKM